MNFPEKGKFIVVHKLFFFTVFPSWITQTCQHQMGGIGVEFKIMEFLENESHVNT